VFLDKKVSIKDVHNYLPDQNQLQQNLEQMVNNKLSGIYTNVSDFKM
jgi:hypothetical protein